MTRPASQDRARIAVRSYRLARVRVLDVRCLEAVTRATIKESTNENNTDVDLWADARRLRINGKPCSKPWRCLNLNMRLPETLADGPLLWPR